MDILHILPQSRQEKEELVRELYFNEGKSYHEIAKEARVSLRDIKGILNRDTQGELSLSKAAQAYRMFLQDKSPMEVAIALDLREPEVTQLYKESWTLRQIYDLNQIYRETEGNLAPFLKLFKLAKSKGMKEEHVVWLLKVSNNDLPELENRYYNLKPELDLLEAKKQNLVRIIQDYDNQATALGKRFDSKCLSCEQEEVRLNELQKRRAKEEALVRQFENNNEEYIKITKTAEEKVLDTLSKGKDVLGSAVLCVMESIRNNPDKYTSLIHYDEKTFSSTVDPNLQFYNYAYGKQQEQQQYANDSFKQICMDILIEDTEKLYNKLSKELIEKIIDEYSDKSSSATLPSLIATDNSVC